MLHPYLSKITWKPMSPQISLLPRDVHNADNTRKKNPTVD